LYLFQLTNIIATQTTSFQTFSTIAERYYWIRINFVETKYPFNLHFNYHFIACDFAKQSFALFQKINNLFLK